MCEDSVGIRSEEQYIPEDKKENNKGSQVQSICTLKPAL